MKPLYPPYGCPMQNSEQIPRRVQTPARTRHAQTTHELYHVAMHVASLLSSKSECNCTLKLGFYLLICKARWPKTWSAGRPRMDANDSRQSIWAYLRICVMSEKVQLQCTGPIFQVYLLCRQLSTHLDKSRCQLRLARTDHLDWPESTRWLRQIATLSQRLLR